MRRPLALVAPVLLTAALGLTTAACGSSSHSAGKDGSDSAACKRLEADSNSLDGSTPPTSISQLQSYLASASAKFKGDLGGADTQLKTTINKATSILDKAAADAKAGNASAVQTDLNGLDSLDSDLDASCPDEATDSPSPSTTTSS